jgi:hypothetical protein
MAKIDDELGDPEGAFAAAEHMNRAVPRIEEWRRRGAAYRAGIRDYAAALTPEWARRVEPLPAEPGLRAPAFLVGFPRSGTTLLDTFLMGHPGTQLLEEIPMLERAREIVGGTDQLAEGRPDLLRRARHAYEEELARHVDPAFDGLVIDKLPLSMLGLPVIHALFADSRVIFAQRHPCDVVLSGFMQSFVLNEAMACFLDIGDAADFYDAAMTLWTRSRELLPHPVRTLVYEELVSDPERALRPLVEFLGLDWRDELIDHRATAARRGPITTPSYDQVTQPLSVKPGGRWRRYEKQLAPVLPVLLPWAKRLGYGD